MSGSRRLRAVLLPPIRWQPERDAWRPGAGPSPFALYEQLAAQGIDTVPLDPGRRPLNPLDGRGAVLAALDPARALRVLLRERRADIIVSVFEGGALPLLLARQLLGFGVPVVLWDIGLTETWRLRERVLDRVVPRADGIFVLSAHQRPYIAARWGRADGVELAGHYVDSDFFTPPPQADADGPVLALGEDAGRDFACLLAAAPGIDADIVLKTRAIAPGQALPPRVAVRPERLDPVALRALDAASRVVVVPLTETLNASGVSTVLEASATGCALVVSDTAAMRDFMVPGETCLAVPPGDPAALAAAVGRLLADPATRARLGANARRLVERRFSVAAFAARFGPLLRRYARG